MTGYAPLDRPFRQRDRTPVNDVDQAVARVVFLRVNDEWSDQTYDAAVKLMADVFWITEREFRAKVIKASRELWGSDA